MTTKELEIYVAKFYSWRKNIIIPNLSWGMFNHELDLAILTPSKLLHEVELKISKSDLHADFKKKKHKRKHDKRIVSLTYAMPDTLKDCFEEMSEECGIISVTPKGKCKFVRKSTPIKDYQKITIEDEFKLLRLMHMRIWGLKVKLLGLEENR